MIKNVFFYSTLFVCCSLLSACASHSSAPKTNTKKSQAAPIPIVPTPALKVRKNGVYQQRIESANHLKFNYFKFLPNHKVLALYDFKGSAAEVIPLFTKIPHFFAYSYQQHGNRLILSSQQASPPDNASLQPLMLDTQGRLQSVNFLNIQNKQVIYTIRYKNTTDYTLNIYHGAAGESFQVTGHKAVPMAHQRVRISQVDGQQLYNLQGKALGQKYNWIATQFVHQGLLAYNGAHFGIIDKNGKVQLPFRYDDIEYSPEDNSLLVTLRNRKMLLDRNFKPLLQGQFYAIGTRKIHQVIPIQKKAKKNWQFFSLNTRDWLKFDATEYKMLNSADYFQVTTSRGGIVVNTQGKPALSMYVDHAQILDDQSFLATALTGMKSRFDANGNRLMPFFKEDLTPLGDVIQVQDGDNLGLIQLTGEAITPMDLRQISYLGEALYQAQTADGKLQLYQSRQEPYRLFAQQDIHNISPLQSQRLVIQSEDESVIFDSQQQRVVLRTDTLKIAPFSTSGYAIYQDRETQKQGLINAEGQLVTEANYHNMRLKGDYLLATDESQTTYLYHLPELMPISTIKAKVELTQTRDQQSYGVIYQPLAPKAKPTPINAKPKPVEL